MVDSARAEDCIYVLTQYKTAAYLANLQTPTVPPAPNPGDAAVPNPAIAAQTTLDHRQTLVQTPVPDPQGGGVGMPRLNPDAMLSDEDLFAQEFERRTKVQNVT
jgi:hypothetical protein